MLADERLVEATVANIDLCSKRAGCFGTRWM